MKRFTLLLLAACVAFGFVSIGGCSKTIDENMTVSFDK